MVGQILSHNRAIQVLNFIGVRKFGHPIFSVPDIIFICFPIEHSSNEWFLFREPVPPILWTFTKLWNFISWWFVFFNFLFRKIFRKFFFPPLNMFYLDQVGVIWIKLFSTGFGWDFFRGFGLETRWLCWWVHVVNGFTIELLARPDRKVD